jgi:hypothetical protein
LTDVPPSTPARRARLILALVGVALLLVAFTLYAARRSIAREALVGWLQSRGIPAEADVEAFGLTGFVGRVRVGDPDAPDFAAARAEVRYAIRGFGVEVHSVTLREPVMRASYRGGKLSVGSLDPLIEEFTRRPPRPEATKPRIAVDDGLLLLTTDYGPVRLSADAVVDGGRLMSLEASSAPARLKGARFEAELGEAVVSLRTHEQRVVLTLDAPVARAAADSLAVQSARLRVTAAAPYPDLEKRRGDGPVIVRANLTGRRLAAGDQALEGAQLSAAFTGTSAGWIEDLTTTGELVADLRAEGARADQGSASGLRLAATAADLRWSRKGGDALSATLKMAGGVDGLSAADLRLRTAAGALQGPVSASARGVTADLSGSLTARGAWTGLGGPVAEDSPQIVAVKRAARGFRVAAPGLALKIDPGRSATFAISRPLRLLPDAGGQVTLSPRGRVPLFGPDGGAFRLTASGGGLPHLDADVGRLVLADGAVTASGRVKAGLSLGPIEDAEIDAAGALRIAGGAMRFTAGRCATVSARHVELGENDVEAASGSFCPVAGRPLLTFAGGDWRIDGQARAAAARAPFLQAAVSDADARVVFGLARGRLYADVAIADAGVADAAPQLRFNPMRMSGQADLARDIWTADLAIRLPEGPVVARAGLSHNSLSGQGGVGIDSGVLTFADGGLQPDQLSPLASAIGSPVEGEAAFTGRFDWTAAGATSGGRLTVPRLDFQSPLGRATGLSGDIAFTSLAPLIAAPGQTLRVESVAALVPITGASVSFALDEKALVVSGAEAAVGGGRVLVESLEVPLLPDAPIRGVLRFEGVQLHDLVEASPFGERVEFDARVSGRVPFEVVGQRLRVVNGDLKAIAPGRLSVNREAITPVATTGGAVTAPVPLPAAETTDTFTDFAYQAMEHLAFDTLDLTLNSREDGRLSALFHIIGRHDPPQRQEIRLTLVELIQRDFLGRKLPLPSNTGVNLTLDTTLNLDDLLRDYAGYLRLRSSPPVQP